MTTPASLYADFLALISAGRLSGDAPAGLATLLAKLGVASLVLGNGQAGQTVSGAWMTGSTRFRSTDWRFTLDGQPAARGEAGSPAELTLTLTIATPDTAWTFSQAFPDQQLPKSRRAKSTMVPAPRGQGLILGPSVLAPLILESPTIDVVNFPAGAAPLPRLSGWLRLAGSSLAHYIDYLGSDRLRLEGSVDLGNPAQPIFSLDAPAPNATTGFGPHVALDAVGIRLRNDFPDPSPLPLQGAPTSAAMLYATFSADTVPRTVLDMSTPLLIGDHIWPIYVSFGKDPLTLGTGAQMLGKLIGAPDGAFDLPAGVPLLNAFGVSELEFGLYPPASGNGPGVAYSSITVVSTEPWHPPVPFVQIDQVGVRWTFDWSSDPTLMTASIWGTMSFGARKTSSLGAMAPVVYRAPSRPNAPADPPKVTLTVRMDIPDMAFLAYTENPIELPIADAFAAYFSTPPPDVPRSLTISDASFLASLPRKTYQGEMTVLGQWPLTFGNIVYNLDRIEFRVQVSQSAVSGSIVGTVSMTLPEATPVQLMLGAEYPGDGHWLFNGELVGGPINLPKFVTAFLGYPYPDWMKNDTFVLELTAFSVNYSTAPGNPYRVSAGVAASLKDTVLGIPVAMTATAKIERQTRESGDSALDPAMQTSGTLSGSFSVSRLKLTAGLSFRANEKTYLFSVAWRKLVLSGATAWIGKDAARHQILTLRLSGETLGGVIRFLVGLANPNANFRLDPPWDFLDTIELGRFAVVIDPTLEQVTLTYDLGLELAFARIDTVGLRYDRSTGTPQVNVVLTGKVLGTAYTPDKPLSWDAINQAPPALPGKGQSLFDLRYFGLGQHISLDGMTRYTSIAEVIEAMRDDMRQVDDLRKNPLRSGKTRFDAASQWLFGIDCKVMDTVSLKLVLHDPDLYGALIALSGPDAGSLAGLSFELMYKKVTADIGVFHVRLQVPSAFRQLQFGAISVTLGIINVDIYTNGNFLVDLGFPHNRDFSVSFGLEAGIFNGRGGIYVGLRDGATSDRVPRISNGTFSPVIELGVGLEIGVGRTFNKGPLSAGLYVDVVVIFEGVLGWFRPADASRPNALYYWCRGTAGIVGKLYGSVDFKIISVSVSVEAHAYATLTLASNQATLIELDVGVSVNAKVKFLFFSVSFSFGLQIEASFSIGQSSATPWTLLPGESTRSRLSRSNHAYTPPRLRPAHVKSITRHAYRLQRFGHPASSALAAAGNAIARSHVGPPQALRGNGLVAGIGEPSATFYHLQFARDAAVFPQGEVRNGAITLVPAFTIANVPVAWSAGEVPPQNPDPDYRIAMLLLADTAVPPDADTIADSQCPDIGYNAVAVDAASTTFGNLVEGLLRWSLDALGVAGSTVVVTLGALEELVEQLAMPEAANQGFTWPNLDGFFGHNLNLALSAAPDGELPAVGVTVFPMVPTLEWECPQLPPDQAQRQFWSYQPVDAHYETQAMAYFARLDARAPNDRPNVEHRLRTAGDDSESMASFVFRDYCLMVARAAVQAAVNLLSSYPHHVAATDSLAGIAGSFPTTQVAYVRRPDDDVDSVAEVYGLSAAELVALNPGIVAAISTTPVGAIISVSLGVTPQSIASGNPSWPLVAGKAVALGELIVQIQPGDTLSAIAERHDVELASWMASPALLRATGVIRAGASAALPSFSYANPLALPLETVAAAFWVRLSGYPVQTSLPDSAWYAEAIAALNPDAIPVDGPLPPTLLVPAQFDQDVPGSPTAPLTWRTLPGDTLDSVAGAVAATQRGASDRDYTAWLQAVILANATPLPGHAIAMPTDAVLVARPNDTLATLRLRLLVDGSEPVQQAGFTALMAVADVLAPLATLAVPGAHGTIADGQTLLSFAQRYGLPLEDLGARIQHAAGVLAVVPDSTLKIPVVPALPLDSLMSALHDPRIEAGISGQIARFMLHGARLPAPVLIDGTYQATGPMTGLYELVGQQVVGPPPGDGGPSLALSLTMRQGQPCTWLRLAAATTVADGQTRADLFERHPQIDAFNAGLSRWSAEAALPAGMVVRTGIVESITLALTAAQLTANYPANSLVPTLQGAVSPLCLYREMSVRHVVTQAIAWRTTVAPRLPGPVSTGSSPSVWLLPADMRAISTPGGGPASFSLRQVTPQQTASTEPVALDAYAWGTLIDVDVRAVPGSPHTVEVLGADTADRQRLASLLQYLGVIPESNGQHNVPPSGEGATLILAWQLPVSSGAPTALTTTSLDLAATFLVKANLSTETHSGASAVRAGLDLPAPTAGPYFASANDSAQFITLLWEASVVGGGGYWLRATGGEEPIPQGIFDQDGRATLTILIQLASQSTINGTAGWPVRKLFPFNDCAVVGDGVDPGSITLFAQASEDVELDRVATVPQGQVGFTLDLANPGKDATEGSQQLALRQLYSLIGYQLTETPAFIGSDEGQPVGPAASSSSGSASEDVWKLMRVVPIHRFAKTNPLLDLPAYPPRELSPYAGIAGASAQEVWTLAKARIALWFHDVFGNASATAGNAQGLPPGPRDAAAANGPADLVAAVDVAVGYTDALIGVGSWPCTTLSYEVIADPVVGGQALLSVRAALQAIAYQPGAGEGGDSLRSKAERDRDRYAAIYYQVMQPDLQAAVLTSLRQRRGSAPDVMPVPMAPLRSLAIGTYVFVGGQSMRRRFLAQTPTSINVVLAHFGVSYRSLGSANAHVRLDAILAGPHFALPQSVMFRAGQTVAEVAAAAKPPVDAVQILQDEDNVHLPLMPGVEITIPATALTVPASAMTLLALLGLAGCSLERLIAANAARPGLLAPGFIFECNGIRVQVDEAGPGAEASLAGVTSVFNDRGLPFSPAMVASLNADRPGLFRSGASLEVDAYLLKSTDTLALNGTGATPAQIAALNIQTTSLFPDGTPLFLQTLPTALPAGTVLGEIAADASITPGDLLRHNGTAALATAAHVIVPGLSDWPEDLTEPTSPYSIRAGQTLVELAPCFGPPDSNQAALSPLALATLNRAMPAVIAGGRTVTIAGSSVDTFDGDSFNAVCNRFAPAISLDALVASIEATPGMLAAGGLLLCPPARLGTASNGQPGVTAMEAGARFGIDPSNLLGANAGTPGLLHPGVTLRASSTDTPERPSPRQTIAAADSMTALLERFAHDGISVTIDDLLAANGEVGFLAAGASLTLPPADALYQTPLAVPAASGEWTWCWPDTVFPICSWLQLERAYALADPGLAGTPERPSAVVRTRTALATARQGAPSNAAKAGPSTLAGFATQLQSAIAGLRVATGKTLAGQQENGATDVWAVDFTATGIASVTVAPPVPEIAGTSGPQPRSFALRPLSTALVARQNVQIAVLDPVTGLLGRSKTSDYQGIDLDVWASTFLTDLEHVISAAYVTNAYLVNRAALETIIGAKKSLAAAIADGLDYVLADDGNADADTYRASAIEALRQSLLVSLAQGYRTSAVIQYSTSINSVFDKPTARLSGVPVATLSSEDPSLKAASLSNGKVSLKAGPSLVDVLVSVPDVAAHRSLTMQLDYQVVELELNIADVVDGYASSDWLSFVTPIHSGTPGALDIALGAPTVPIPLRAYPQMPTLLDHRAVQAREPASMNDAVRWSYAFMLRHQSTEQDQIEITLTFNASPTTLRKRTLAEDDLFGQLAQYTENAAGLSELLAGLADGQPADDGPRLANALSSFAVCAAGVAGAWARHWTSSARVRPSLVPAATRGPVQEVYGFSASLATDQSATWYRSLMLVRTATPEGGNLAWPTVACLTPDGVTHRLTPAAGPVAGIGEDPGVQCYLFPTEEGKQVPAFELLSFDFRFDGLAIATYQNAIAKVSVVRNERLLGPTGAATRPDFIYRTPVVSYLQPVVPFIDVATSLPIGRWSYDPVACPLEALFTTIFDGDARNRTIVCGIRYGYQLAPGNPPDVPALETHLPVYQTPAFVYSTTTVADICAKLEQWNRENLPAQVDGRWTFWVELHSSIDPSLQRPLLRLKSLVAPLAPSVSGSLSTPRGLS